MTEKVQQYINDHHLANSGTPILLACSGGVDSMVLAEVLLKLNFKIGIAHCNFQLRGADSDGDEAFVKQFADDHHLEFHAVRFDTKTFKKANALSTQMAARELRYAWLEEMRKTNGYHHIATAHHLDDQLETILLNFTRGTGIRGMAGMRPKQGHIIRPLLDTPKAEILGYAETCGVAWREDASNAAADYQRNQLRHDVIPHLLKLNPALHETVRGFSEKMHDYALLSGERLEAIKKRCYSEASGIVTIKPGFLKTHGAGKTILFHLLKEFGFNTTQAWKVFESLPGFKTLKNSTGKQFLSETHRLVIDRKNICIIPRGIDREDRLLYEEIPGQIRFNDLQIDCAIVPVAELNMKAAGRFAYLDADKLEFPLMLRYWNTADYFYPYGMSKPQTPGKPGKKKLSKYFKDEKFSVIEKENTVVLFSGEKLAWLVGHRIDDRFKVTEKTKRVLKLVLLP